MEIKPPIPVIPPPAWEEIKDLQEWVKYRQERPEGDQVSETVAGLWDRLEHFPGGWLAVSLDRPGSSTGRGSPRCGR